MLLKFLERSNTRYRMNNGAKFKLRADGTIKLSYNDEFIISDDVYDLQNWAENHGCDFRICNNCGKPISSLFMDCGDFYSCANCFENQMNDMYGKESWRPVADPESVNDGGFYEYLSDDNEWEDTGIFWTEL